LRVGDLHAPRPVCDRNVDERIAERRQPQKGDARPVRRPDRAAIVREFRARVRDRSAAGRDAGKPTNAYVPRSSVNAIRFASGDQA
jgi:hypothetical protein